MLEYLVSAILVAIGLYGVLLKRNLFKVLIGVALMALGVASFVVATGGSGDGVDIVSQTVALVAVVGGVGVVSLMLVTAVRLYEKYGTLDIREMRRLKG